jgi:hypothetical protein
MRGKILTAAFAGLLFASGGAMAADTGKQSYCINDHADFYPYKEGQNCRSGYQIGDGNCRLKDGSVVAVNKAECTGRGGEVALPAPAALVTGDADPKKPVHPQPLTVQNPK